MLEWIMVEYTGKINYDTPILRFGKAFTTLGIALALSATFQVSKSIDGNTFILYQ